MALGILLLRHAELAIGGTAGISFLIHYVFDLPLGAVFFVVNLPFYLFAYRAFGWVFTLKTLAAVSLLSLMTQWVPKLLDIVQVNATFAAVSGGLLMGMGVLILFRHRCSLGGLGVLAIFCQERFGWRAGHVQLALDAIILLSAFFVLEPKAALLSILCAACLNLVLAINHKPGRYAGM